MIDNIIMGAGVAIAVGGFVWWLVRGRPDPLRSAPARGHDFNDVALVVPVLAYVAALVATAGIVKLLGGSDDDPALGAAAGSVAQIAGAVACLAVAAWRFDGGAWRFMFGPGLRRDASSHVTADVHRGGRVALRVCALVVCATLVAVGVCPLVVSATRGAVAFFAPGYHFDPHATIQALRDDAVPAGLTVCLWLGAVVVAPIAEEVFFRGVVQTMLARMCRGRWSAIIGTAIVFGVIHVPQPDTVPAVTAFGVLLGYTYERTGAVAVPIVIHAGFNLTNLVAAGVA